jgi:hypothetical protein
MFTAIFWKKTWVWFKNYWYFPIIFVMGILLLFSGKGASSKAFKLFDNQKERYKKEIEVVEKNNAKANREKEKAVQANKEKIKELESQHNFKIEELESNKEQELQKTIKEFEDNPDELARRIAKILDAHLVER